MTLSNTGWDTAVPADNTFIKNLPNTTRTAKDQLGYRLEQEHTDFSSGSPDYGGIHVAGSAVVFASNDLSDQTTDAIKRPGSGLDLTTALDKGRLSIPTDGNNGLYFYESVGTWTAVGIAGMDTAIAEGDGSTLLGDQIALLPGRAGGQTLLGGTDSADTLSLGGTAHATPGPIEIVAARTTLLDLNGLRVIDVATPTASNDAIGRAQAILDPTDLAVEATNASSDVGGIAVAAHGTGTGSDSENRTADVGFPPDIVIAWNTSNNPSVIWTSDDASNIKRLGGNGVDPGGNHGTTGEISVTGDIITFPMNESHVNNNGKTFYYIAIKTNRQVEAT